MSTGGDDLAMSTGGTCVPGTACHTSDPGDCAMGTVSCSGNQPTCVSSVTMQRCYDGPANTSNVGICKPGMQTCTGALGACTGEVLPARQEDCFNDLDDDCDGVVNNGCPQSITTGTPRSLALVGGSGGGSAYSLRCPAGAYVQTMTVYSNNNGHSFPAGIDISCATPALVRGATSYSVTPTAVTLNPNYVHASEYSSTVRGATTCDKGGWAPSTWFLGDTSNDARYVNAMGNGCGKATLSFSSDNKLTVTTGYDATDNCYGYWTGTPGCNSVELCNTDEVLIGFDGHTGAWFDSVTPICAPLVVVYK